MLDAIVVLSSVLVVPMGGVWALILTGTNFNIAAGVGFISITGVAVMNGLLLVSTFNQMRANGLIVREAISSAVCGCRARPITMTALAAIFGLLPAALSKSNRLAGAEAAGHRRDRRDDAHAAAHQYHSGALSGFYGHREPPAGRREFWPRGHESAHAGHESENLLDS